MKLIKYKKNELPPEELDALTRELIQAKIGDDYKNKWQQKLATQHGVVREVKAASPLKKPIVRRLFWKVAAAILLLALIAAPLVYSSMNDPVNRALAMIDQDVFTSMGGGKKGASMDTEKDRQTAAQEFNFQHFAKANQLYLQLVAGADATQDDSFYLAYTYLKLKDFPKGIASFYQARALQTDDNYLREEINWYLSLALLAQGSSQEARMELRNIKQGEWKYSEAQKLLEAF